MKMVVRTEQDLRKPYTAEQRAEVEALAAMPDSEIDFSDIPELPPGAWKNAVRNPYYKPVKKQVTMRLDADVIAWLKKDGDGWLTRANAVLRERFLAELWKERKAQLAAIHAKQETLSLK